MKRILFALLFICLTSSLPAQKDFEGSIKYKMIFPKDGYSSREESEISEMNIHFGYRCILVENKDERVLILIDSGKIYSIRDREKLYIEKKLFVQAPVEPVGKLVVAGYAASPVKSDPFPANDPLNVQSTVWYADSLFFNLPEKYEGNEELLLIHQNKILLKARITKDRIYGLDEGFDTTRNNLVYMDVFATEVNPKKLLSSLFQLPDGYTRHTLYSVADTSTLTDDTSAVMDTTVIVPEPKPVSPPLKEKNPPKPVKNKNKSIEIRKED